MSLGGPGRGKNAIAPYVLRAQATSGKACEGLVMEALSNPEVYTFSELLDLPSVAELANNPGTEATYRLLKIFTYGTFTDYIGNAASLPPLSDVATKKLKQLSIVNISQASKIIPYSTLQSHLQLQTIRHLEDLLVDAIGHEVLFGKLDQEAQQLEVEWMMGRDVSPEQLRRITKTMLAWKAVCEAASSKISDEMIKITKRGEEERASLEEFNATVEELRKKSERSQVNADWNTSAADDWDPKRKQKRMDRRELRRGV